MEKANWVLGINPGFGGFNYHDPSVALIDRGRIVCAMEEERFCRVKTAPGRFPALAIKACLDKAKIDWSDINKISVGYSVKKWKERIPVELSSIFLSSGFHELLSADSRFSKKNINEIICILEETINDLTILSKRTHNWSSKLLATTRIREFIPPCGHKIPIDFVEHHKSHAASAYLLSGYNAALAIVGDGVGESDSLSAWYVEKNNFFCIDRCSFPNSIGYFYASITSYLGFRPWRDEGTIMALAPYGRENKDIKRCLANVYQQREKPIDFGEFVQKIIDNGFTLNEEKAKSILEKIFGLPARKPHELLNEFHKDVAWASQKLLEHVLVNYTLKHLKSTNCKNICLAGGVFLNTKLNQKIRELPECKSLFIQPVSGDAGLAIGAGLFSSLQMGMPIQTELNTLSLGYEANKESIKAILDQKNIRYECLTNLFELIVDELINGSIIFWYSGAAEFGPRALGNRSIIADPRKKEIAHRINSSIKNRQFWRPFAPIILEEFASELLKGFSIGQKAPFMIETYFVEENWKEKLEGVIHEVDGTTRPQTINEQNNTKLFKLLTSFYNRTGVPALLNTSMNKKNKPIVNTPEEAIDFFLSTDAEIMVIESFLIKRNNYRN